MRIARLAFACVVFAALPASAQRIGYEDDFVGWSADGTWYVLTTSGTDEMPVPVLCVSKVGDKPKTWPKKVPLPADDSQCTDRWDEMFPNPNADAQTLVANAQKLVVAQKSATKGPAGETYIVKRQAGVIVEVDVLRKGKRIARGFFELKFADMALPDMVSAYWRKDGGAVAVTAGWSPDPQADGYGPPTFVIMLPLDGSTANAKSVREQAKDLNVDGMKLLTAKKLDDAQKKFQQAADTDDTYMLAYYNLACTASLRHDKDGSLKALKVLAESDDKEAKQYLAKGKTDHDLDFIADDPEAAKLLNRKPKKK